jgi:hypothetical protein
VNTELIAAAVLFAPAALVGPPLLIAAHRTTRHSKAVRAMLADERAKRATAPTDGEGPPPDGGQPTPLPDTGPLAQVIPLHRHAA